MLPWLGYLVLNVITQALPRFYGTPAAGTGPDLVFRLTMFILLLALTAQLVLVWSPKDPRRDAMLAAARRSFQDA